MAGAQCSGRELRIGGSNIRAVGNLHSNGELQMTGGGQGNVITGILTFGGHSSGNNIALNTTLFPPLPNNVFSVPPREYPISYRYVDFVPGGWIYDLIQATDPNHYHFYNDEITIAVLQAEGWLTNSVLDEGVYVAPVGFDYSGAGSSGLVAPAVTIVTLGEIDISSNDSLMQPYWDGLLLFTEGLGNPCASSSAVNFVGSSVNTSGLFYAPNGNINRAASDNSTLNGSLIAGTIDVTGSSNLFIANQQYKPADADLPNVQLLGGYQTI